MNEPKNAFELHEAYTTIEPVKNGLVNKHDQFMQVLVSFRKLNGKVISGDFITEDRAIALDHLYGFIQEAKSAAKPGSVKATKWQFRYSIHRSYDRTLDDLFDAYLRWATVPVETGEYSQLINVSMAFRRLEVYAGWLEDVGEVLVNPPINAVPVETGEYSQLINVSMAFRRLEVYAGWLEDVGEVLVNPPINGEEMDDPLYLENAYRYQYTYDKYNRLVIFRDWPVIGKTQFIPYDKKIRYAAYHFHRGIYDDNAQKNGVVMVSNAANVNFWVSRKYEAKLRSEEEALITAAAAFRLNYFFFFGYRVKYEAKLRHEEEALITAAAAFRLNYFFFVDPPFWLSTLASMWGRFLPKPIAARIMICVGDYAKLVEIIGADCVPKNYVDEQKLKEATEKLTSVEVERPSSTASAIRSSSSSPPDSAQISGFFDSRKKVRRGGQA
eukprot:CAMPEP_0194395336 /NCGR_PEP_ID=MMETSP0174-20130528/124365_1 /TAXON_ID=216777 /ORGANISM="Proboscia alata, Strain PI-D3" /LENGTH=440 /DNA_ID=CAMNT_0039191257 /DNA_START=775 /DNA_END=2096 /DNA_ORIENTATION=+